MLAAPIQSQQLADWVNYIQQVEIPVLKHSAREIARLQEDEDKLSARGLSAVVLNDPMMVFKV